MTDADLTRAAQAGDAAALGILLERHRARLLAHALQLVGHTEAHDAVQDTFVVAMRRIGSVRDPAQVEGWLHTVLRTRCLDRLRARPAEADVPDVAAPAADEPESIIEELALRDWVWTAVERLSDPLRLVTMLRHFSSCTAYADIATVCDVPVGTVRSRLNEARRILADELLRTASAAHGDAAARTRSEHARWSAAFDEADPDQLIESMHPDLEIRFADRAYDGREAYRAIVDADLSDGVRLVIDDVVVGRGITILESRFVNPAWDPFHCPPGMTQVAIGETAGLTKRLVFHHWPRVTGPGSRRPPATASP